MVNTIRIFLNNNWQWFLGAAGVPVVKMALDFIAGKLNAGDKMNDMFDGFEGAWDNFFLKKLLPMSNKFFENLGILLTSWWQEKLPLLGWIYEQFVEPGVVVIVSLVGKLLAKMLVNISGIIVSAVNSFEKGLRSDNHEFK